MIKTQYLNQNVCWDVSFSGDKENLRTFSVDLSTVPIQAKYLATESCMVGGSSVSVFR